MASQALITGTNPLGSEAVTLNFWPKIRVYIRQISRVRYIFLWLTGSYGWLAVSA